MRLKLCIVIFRFLISCNAYNYTRFNVFVGNSVRGHKFSCAYKLLNAGSWRDSRFFVIHNTTWHHDNRRILQNLENYAYVISDGTNVSLTGQLNLIILTSNFESLRKIFTDVDIHRLDSNGEILIIIRDIYKDMRHVQASSKGISNMFWNANRPNAVFYIQSIGKIMIATFRAFEDNCRPGPLKLITNCHAGHFENEHVDPFPKKMRNALNCTMKCTWMFRDIMTVDFGSHSQLAFEAVVNEAGKQIVRMMTEAVNLRLNITDQQEEIDVTKDEFGRNAYIAVSGFIPTAKKLVSLDFLPGYQPNALVIAYHDSLIHRYYWKNIFLPFKSEVWLALFISCSLSGINMLIWQQCYKRIPARLAKISFFAFLSVLCLHGRLKSSNIASRASYIMWAIYTFYIATAYSSGLYGFLTSSEEMSGYETFEKLDTSGLLIGGTQRARKFFHDENSPSLMALHTKYHVLSNERTYELLTNGTIATAILQSSVQTKNMMKSSRPTYPYRMLSENLMSFVSPMYVSRGSPIIMVIKPRILYLHDHGFVEYWNRHYSYVLSRRKRRNFEGTAEDDEKRIVYPLRLEHFYSLFCMVFIGALFGSIAFGLELYYQRKALYKATVLLHNVENFEKSIVKEVKKDIGILCGKMFNKQK